LTFFKRYPCGQTPTLKFIKRAYKLAIDVDEAQRKGDHMVEICKKKDESLSKKRVHNDHSNYYSLLPLNYGYGEEVKR
jgi:hypothetical protein